MKKSDMSFGDMLKSLWGKKETNVPQDTTDEIDADYYRGSYNTVKPSEDDVPASVPTSAQSEVPVRSEPVSVTKADTDDFDFVDEDESREICEVKPSGVKAHTPARSDNEDNGGFVFADDDDDDNDDEIDDEKTAEITEIARKLNINIIKLSEGDKIRITDEDRIECLYTYKNTVSDNRNDICLTLKVVSGSFSAIFAGDIPTETEQVILANSNIGKTNLFKVNHHGSKGSNSKEWLSTIKPDISVISCAIKNNYGHPADETLLRLENCKTRIFYTMYSGQISIIKDDKENLIINKFLENESAAVR